MRRKQQIVITLVTLILMGIGSAASADEDDYYPWMAGAGFHYNPVFLAYRSSGGGWMGNAAIDYSSDEDYYVMICGRGYATSVGVDFSDASGDIDIEVYTMNGHSIGSSTSTTDNESVDVSQYMRNQVVMRVYLWSGTYNSYSVKLYCSQ